MTTRISSQNARFSWKQSFEEQNAHLSQRIDRISGQFQDSDEYDLYHQNALIEDLQYAIQAQNDYIRDLKHAKRFFRVTSGEFTKLNQPVQARLERSHQLKNQIINKIEKVVQNNGIRFKRESHQLANEFERMNSCCQLCHQNLQHKLLDLVARQQNFSKNLQALSDDQFSYSEERELSLVHFNISLELTDKLKKQIAVKMPTISREICFKEFMRSLAGDVFLPSVKRVWTAYKELRGIQSLVKQMLHKTIFKKRTNAERDYIFSKAVVSFGFTYAGWCLLEMILEERFTYLLPILSGLFVVIGTSVAVASAEKFGLNIKPDDRYKKYISDSHPFHTDIAGPIIEETFYRGFLQNGLTFLTGSPLLGLLVSSTLFGVSHFNTHREGNYGHAINAGLHGVGYGLLNNHYGLIYSIYWHCLNNSMCTFAEKG